MTAIDPQAGVAPPRQTGAPGQLTQARVPLESAAVAFSCRDAHGRLPIVLVPQRTSRIQTDLLGLALREA